MVIFNILFLHSSSSTKCGWGWGCGAGCGGKWNGIFFTELEMGFEVWFCG